MWDLSRTITREDAAAAVLPPAFTTLSRRQANIRRGEVTLIAGPPGSGKSSLALAYAVKTGVPTLYFSADTHRHTMAMRSIAMLTGLPQTPDVEHYMATDPAWTKQQVARISNINWCWESAPSLGDVETHIEAFATYWGEDPALVVFDNLIDAAYDSGDEWGSLRSLLREFKWWARETSSAFLVLHHTNEGAQGNPCPPKSALAGKVAQTPALVLTITSDTTGFLGVSAVKNRYGPANPNGGDPVWLVYDPSTMRIDDLEER